VEKTTENTFIGKAVLGTQPNTSFKVRIARKGAVCIGVTSRKGVFVEFNNVYKCGYHVWLAGGNGLLYSEKGHNGVDYMAVPEGSCVIEVKLEDSEIEQGFFRKKKVNTKKVTYIVNDKENCGMAFNIPCDTGDLYPCVHLWEKGDTVEFIE
jgi:hypothetical protein